MLVVRVLDRQRHQVQGQSIVHSESLSPKTKTKVGQLFNELLRAF